MYLSIKNKFVEWSNNHQSEAEQDGWSLFHNIDEDIVEIQRIDEMMLFDCDREARGWVLENLDNPACYDAIDLLLFQSKINK